MKIGLIDVDGHNYPNLPLMKLSAFHKQRGDEVDWYNPLFDGRPLFRKDIVYMSKVFSFSPDYPYYVNSGSVVKQGSGYCIKTQGGVEYYDKMKAFNLPHHIEHIYPDYSIYGITDTAYGFTTRGCPRNCKFCHVGAKEQCRSIKVADVSEFWNGQKYIELLDPNTLACKDWKDILTQLAETKAKVNFNQGLDIRMMTPEKAEMLAEIKLKAIHFAWDRIEDKETITPKFEAFRKASKINPHDLQVYVIVGDRERKILDSDLYRIYWLRDHGYAPYVMIYNKEQLPYHHELRDLQRWVNNRFIFWKCERFEDYKKEG